MSDSNVRVMPRDPHFVPTDSAQTATIALLKKLVPDAEDIEASISESVEFRDCGGNFESVSCPGCRSSIEQETWGNWMGEDHDGEGFSLAPIEMPCCGAKFTLNDLIYDFDQGFSRFEVVATNANIDAVSETDTRELSRLLGSPVRIVYQHV